MKYRVEFAIDVTGTAPEEACQRAWDLLTAPAAMLPVGTVTFLGPGKVRPKEDDMSVGESVDVDLQDLYEEENTPKS